MNKNKTRSQILLKVSMKKYPDMQESINLLMVNMGREKNVSSENFNYDHAGF